MTILWVGNGEDIDLNPVGPAVTSTNSTYLRAGYARSTYLAQPLSVQFNNQQTSWRGYGLFSATTFWLGCRFYNQTLIGAPTSGYTTQDLIRFYDTNGVLVLAVVNTGSGNYASSSMIVQTNSSSNTRTQIGGTFTNTFNYNQAGPDKIDFNINYASSGGYINIYINTSLVFSFTGNITVSGAATTLGGLEFLAGLGDFGATTPVKAAWSEAVVSDSDTRLLAVYTYAPSANGTVTQWTGTAAGLSEIVINDTNGIQTNTASQIQELVVTGTTPSGYFSLQGVGITARTITNSGQPQNLDLGLNILGADYYTTTQAVGTFFTNNRYVWNTNPATSAAWNSSDITTIGAAFRSKT